MELKLRNRTLVLLIFFSFIVATVAYFLAGRIPPTIRSLSASASTLALFAGFSSHSVKTMSTKAPVYFVSHGGVCTFLYHMANHARQDIDQNDILI